MNFKAEQKSKSGDFYLASGKKMVPIYRHSFQFTVITANDLNCLPSTKNRVPWIGLYDRSRRLKRFLINQIGDVIGFLIDGVNFTGEFFFPPYDYFFLAFPRLTRG